MKPRLTWNVAAVAFALIVFAALVLFSPNFQIEHDPESSPFAGDFLQEYLGGYIIRHGDRSRFYDLEYAKALQHDPSVMGITFHRDQFLPIIYPPFYYLVVSPLALLPFKTAAYVWMALMALCFAATVLLLVRSHSERPMLLVWFLPAAMLFVPLLENFASSQKATLALLILTGTYLLLKRKKPFAAGLVFGLLAFKPQLTLVIAAAMLLKRQWRFVAGGLATGLVLVGLSLLVGIDVCGQYLKVSSNMAVYINMPGFQLEKMHCWYGFFKLLFEGLDLKWIQLATGLASVVTIAILARLLCGPLRFEEPAFAIQFAGLVFGTVLLSPHLMTYDLTVVLLPIVLSASRLARSNAESRWLAVLLVLLYILPGFSTQLAVWTRVQATVPVMLALLVVLALWVQSRSYLEASGSETARM